MAEDWQPGDLALCVREGVWRLLETGEVSSGPTGGAVLDVTRVLVEATSGGDVECLTFKQWPGSDDIFVSFAFRKIRPLSEDEEFEECASLQRVNDAADALKRGAIVITNAPKLAPKHLV